MSTMCAMVNWIAVLTITDRFKSSGSPLVMCWFSSPDVLLSGAKHLVQKGLVDGDRLSIMGGSAGGYTTLAVLTFTDVFHVGASYFGVGSA